jgi:hypothetical protein
MQVWFYISPWRSRLVRIFVSATSKRPETGLITLVQPCNTLSSCVRHDGGMELDCHGAGKEQAFRGSLTLSEHREVPSKVPGVPGGMGALSQPSTFRTVEQNAWYGELSSRVEPHPFTTVLS